MNESRVSRPGLVEAAAIGIAAAVAVTAILVTYSRFPPEELYHVSVDGIAGGVGHAVVFLNFPTAFIALAVLAVVTARFLPGATPAERRRFTGAAIVAAGLCLVAGYPGVVRQADLDFKPVNVVPALGVGLVAVLTAITIRRDGTAGSRPWQRIDTAGAVFGGVLVFLGLPWLFGMAGVYVADVPLLSSLFQSKETVAGQDVIYVHLGDHHGVHGMFLALTALTLTRVVGTLSPRWLDRLLSGYLAFMFVYGIANMFQDLWGEQIVKRGWSTYHIKSMVVPELSTAYGLIVLASVAVWLLAFYRPTPGRPAGRRQLLHSS